MGLERNLYKNDKYVCGLGRTYNFDNIITDSDINLFKLHLVSKMLWPEDEESREYAVNYFNELFEGFIEEIQCRGANNLVEYILEETGMEIVDE